ncbi:hypothetical protein [Butyrivibrio sp. INlla16]|nr:hypothetical protein [Butyrivibrio sp. INlla16]SDB56748.1 hypothetical protein SAMN02910263_02898 [Butyrivibrio sp. INlla16]
MKDNRYANIIVCYGVNDTCRYAVEASAIMIAQIDAKMQEIVNDLLEE